MVASSYKKTWECSLSFRRLCALMEVLILWKGAWTSCSPFSYPNVHVFIYSSVHITLISGKLTLKSYPFPAYFLPLALPNCIARQLETLFSPSAFLGHESGNHPRYLLTEEKSYSILQAEDSIQWLEIKRKCIPQTLPDLRDIGNQTDIFLKIIPFQPFTLNISKMCEVM